MGSELLIGDISRGLPGAVGPAALPAGRYGPALASGAHPRLIDFIPGAPAVAGKFEVIISADEVGAGKPAPDIYQATAQRLDVEPGDCVCLEDSGSGILSGARAGMHVIAVPDPRYVPPDAILHEADLVVDSLADLSLAAIDRLGTAEMSH